MATSMVDMVGQGDRQVQVDRALTRAFKGKPPTGKCRASVRDGFLMFCHYQHLVLIWDLGKGEARYTWWERLTDLRILKACLANLSERDPGSGGGREGTCRPR